MTSALIYCRFSPRPDAATSTSNERQEERCRAYAAGKGYNVEGIFKDQNVSGSKLNRVALQAVLEELRPGYVLIVDTPDRLARDMLVTLTIQLRVKAAEARIEFANGTPPSTTPEGELIGNIMAAFAQYQRSIIRKKTKDGLARKRREEGIVGGRCPIGYQRQGGKLVPHPYEQVFIKDILRLHNLGRSVLQITAYMDLEYDNIRGKPWNERTIRRIIKREKNRLDNFGGPC